MLKLTPGINQAVPGLAQEVRPVPLENPILLGWSEALATELGLERCDEALLRQLNGEGPFPLPATAQVYSGHQFGGYTPRLGDGRGCHLGEVAGRELFLKGSGPTPYSRGGDGRAVIRSAVREFLASEALHHLGIPTTRALAVLASDTPVFREQPERGAITVRVTPSHLRFGHFEYFRHTGQPHRVKALLEYALARYFPCCLNQPEPVTALFLEVVERTAETVADWQAAGFVHGVLNSDNMSLLGETFDYGPFAFMDRCDPGFVCNHSDHYGRYAFDQQPGIGWWNLQRLALALSDHLDGALMAPALELYRTRLTARYLWRMEARLGLPGDGGLQPRLDRIAALVTLMQESGVDYHSTLRLFARLDPEGDGGELKARLGSRAAWTTWWHGYRQALSFGDLGGWQRGRAAANPSVVLRTHLAQQVIEAAERNDTRPLRELHKALCRPYDDHPETPHLTEDPPPWASTITLSCSS
ncbi:protein adenylyltransferase SelO [Ferrimonas sediminicola]|uniref:protein adenylyltransferase SelO n=1 Tax=Ferrimonas sediminicola TaxID=2569538 RepID=UPI001E4AFB54|nr:YdiU family protein [Ferrimonas sediminicola]